MPPARPLHLPALGVCLAALGFGYLYLERALGLEPCPLCVLDRIVLWTLAAVFALAHFQRPDRRERIGYDVGALLIAAVGLGVAGRHVYLQTLPPGSLSECGAGFWHLADSVGMEAAVAAALRGTGDCGEVQWTFLGLSIPALTLGVFMVLFALALVDMVQAVRSRPEPPVRAP